MTAEQDIAAIDTGGANTALEVRTALTAVLDRAGATDIGIAAQTCTDNTESLIEWASNPLNDAGGFDLATDNDFWTAPATAVYTIHFGWFWPTVLTNLVRHVATVWLNGTTGVGTRLVSQGGVQNVVAANTTAGSNLFWVASLNANDVLRFYILYDADDATEAGEQAVVIRRVT